MTRTIRTLVLLAAVAVAALAMPGHALATRDGFTHSSQTSVFPQPRDPWRSWGVRSELPRRVGSPHGRDHFVHKPVRVWVPGQWAWNGYGWVWWPGHWGVR